MVKDLRINVDMILQKEEAERQIELFARDTKVKIDPIKKIKFEGDISDLQFDLAILRSNLSTLKKDPILNEAKIKTTQTAINNMSSELTEAKRRLQNLKNTGDENLSRLQKKFDGVGLSVGKLAPIFASVFSFEAVRRFATATFTLTSQVQNLEVAFTTLLGSQEKAVELLKQIDDFAKNTPFNKLQISENAKKLIGFGIEGGKAVNVLQALGNAVSAVGGGDAELGGVITALGQIQAKGKLSQEELNQFAERGIPALRILKEELGLTQEQIGNIGKEGILASEAVPALLAGLQKEFLGSLESQSKTLSGRVSNIIDETQLQLTKFGQDNTGIFDSVLSAVASGVNNLLPIVLGGLSNLTQGVSQSFGDILGIINSTYENITGQAEQSTNNQLTFFKAVVVGFSTVVTFFGVGLKAITGTFKTSIAFWGDLFQSFGNFISGYVGNIATYFSNLTYNIGVAFGNIPNLAKQGLNQFLELVSKTVNSAIKILNKIPKVNIEEVSFKAIDTSGGLKSFRSIEQGIKDLSGSFNFKDTIDTAKSEIGSFQQFTDQAISNLSKSVQSNNANIEKSFDINTLDGLGRKINATKKELDGLKIGSSEYIAKQKELDTLNTQLRESFSSTYKEGAKDIEKATGGAKGLSSAQKEQKENLKDLEKTANDSYKAQIDKNEDLRDSIQKNLDAIEEQKKAYIDLKNEGVSALQEINQELKTLETEEDTSLAERRVSILEEQAGIEKEIAELKKNTEGSDEDRVKQNELIAEQKKLSEELLLIEQNADLGILKQVESYEKLSEAEKILFDQQEKRKKLQEEKLLQSAIANDREVTFTEDATGIKAFVEDEKGVLVELQDFKTAQKAKEYDLEREAIKTKTENLVAQINTEYALLQEADIQRRNLETQYSEFLKLESLKRITVTNEYIKKLKEVQALQRATGVSIPTASTTQAQSTQSVQNTYNTTINANTSSAARTAVNDTFSILPQA